MAKSKDLLQSRLRETIEELHRQVLRRCFEAAEGKGDEVLARKYAHLIEEIARLPRERILALRFLPEMASAGETAESDSARSAPEELVLFRRVAEASGSGFGVADLKGRISYVNPALCRMIGEASPEAALGRSVYEYYPPHHRDVLAREIIPVVLQTGQWTGELPLRSTAGHLTPTIQNIFLVHAGRGTAPHLANLIIDITERKQAEEALRESEERFRSAFENSSVGIYRTAPDGRIVMANPALVRMLGYPSFEALARRNLESEGYEPQYPRAAFKERLARDGRISGSETAWMRRDGTILFVRESAVALRDASGEILYYEGIAEDITECKQAEKALRASEENFRALAENANDGIVIAVGDGVHAYVNRRVAEISGYSVEELLKMGFRDLAAPEEFALLKERYQQRLAGQPIPPKYETTILRKDGTRVVVEVSGARTVWQGRVADTVIVRDVTERKLAEAALRQSEERFRGLVENVAEVLYAIDREGRITYISPTLEPVTGYRSEEVLGRSFIDFFPPEEVERARSNVADILAGGEGRPHEYRMRHKSGEFRWVRVSSRAIREGGETVGLRGVITDIHDLKTFRRDFEEVQAAHTALFEYASDGIAVVQAERIRFANHVLAGMLGYSVTELAGLPVERLIPEEDRAQTLARIREDLASGKTLVYRAQRVLCRDGSVKHMDFFGSAVRLHGRVAFVGIARETRPEAQPEARSG